MYKLKWKQIEYEGNMKTFQLGDELDILHIFESGFSKDYIVIREDAWGDLDINRLDKFTIKDRFDIELKNTEDGDPVS